MSDSTVPNGNRILTSKPVEEKVKVSTTTTVGNRNYVTK